MTKTRGAARRGPVYRIGWFIGRAIIYFIAGSVLWVLIYRFVPPPITFTMIGDMADGESISRDWMHCPRLTEA